MNKAALRQKSCESYLKLEIGVRGGKESCQSQEKIRVRGGKNHVSESRTSKIMRELRQKIMRELPKIGNHVRAVRQKSCESYLKLEYAEVKNHERARKRLEYVEERSEREKSESRTRRLIRRLE
jgi:hypothetical protein